MATLADELANFNIIVVEKWNSSKIGGKRGSSKGKQGLEERRKVTRQQGRAHPTHGPGAAAQDAASSIQNQVACMPAATQAALLQRLSARRSLSRWRRTRAASVR
jgi:hypothetical protein